MKVPHKRKTKGLSDAVETGRGSALRMHPSFRITPPQTRARLTTTTTDVRARPPSRVATSRAKTMCMVERVAASGVCHSWPTGRSGSRSSASGLI